MQSSSALRPLAAVDPVQDGVPVRLELVRVAILLGDAAVYQLIEVDPRWGRIGGGQELVVEVYCLPVEELPVEIGQLIRRQGTAAGGLCTGEGTRAHQSGQGQGGA